MARNLTARKVESAKPDKYSDGGNLYLIVSETGARKWVLRFTWRGREMGLGSAASVPLADAREKAASARRKIAQALTPLMSGNAPVAFLPSGNWLTCDP
jgi:Arm DNA-binding domain